MSNDPGCIPTQTRKGIRRLASGAWAVVSVRTRYEDGACEDVKVSERLLQEIPAGIGAKRTAIAAAGTNRQV